MAFVYHEESAGNPNIPRLISRYNRSNKDNVIKSFKNVSVKFDVLRFEIKTTILKIFPSTPTHETV